MKQFFFSNICILVSCYNCSQALFLKAFYITKLVPKITAGLYAVSRDDFIVFVEDDQTIENYQNFQSSEADLGLLQYPRYSAL